MRRLPFILPAAIVVSLCATVHSPAEVRVVLTGAGQPRVSAVIEMRGGTGIWSPVNGALAGDFSLFLNPAGDRHGDGPPSIRMNPVTELPEAVWALRSLRSTEVVWSRFDGASWTAPVAISAGGRALDPRLWIDGRGNRRVAFWRRGFDEKPDALFVTTLPGGEEQWWLPQMISLEGAAARRPDIRSYPGFGTFLVAEEQFEEGVSLTVFHLPAADGDTPPQRDSDPWGRQRVHLASAFDGGLDVQLLARPGSGGLLPQIQWVEGLGPNARVGMMYYDTQSLTWSKPFFFALP